MQRITTKRFIMQFIEFGETPVYRWANQPFTVTTPVKDFGSSYTVEAHKLNEQNLQLIFKQGSVEMAKVNLTVANNNRGHLPWSVSTSVTDFFLRCFNQAWYRGKTETAKFHALADFWFSIDKYVKKSRTSKLKALNSRIKTQKWDLLTNSIYNDIAAMYYQSYSELHADLANLQEIEQQEFESRYFTPWYENLYLKTYAIYVRVGYPRGQSTLVPYFAYREQRSFSACVAEQGLYNFNGYWVYPEDCEAFNGSYAPSAYINQHRTRCRTCGAEMHTSQSYDGECSACVGIEAHKLVIHPYSTRAEQMLQFKLGKKSRPKMLTDNIYYGLELEYESDDQKTSVVRTMKILDGHAILKRDGSINTGFEIVTCPASRDVHSDIFKRFYEQFESGELKLKAAPNCGFHIHISKKPLSYLSLGKINAFLNNPDNYDLVTKIAGRKSTYAKCEPHRKHVCYVWNNDGNGSDRYNMLNINNRNTVEFRMFAPPKTYADFQRCLDFVESMVDYSLPCNHIGSLSAHQQADQYLAFLAKNRKTYPALTTHLKGIV